MNHIRKITAVLFAATACISAFSLTFNTESVTHDALAYDVPVTVPTTTVPPWEVEPTTDPAPTEPVVCAEAWCFINIKTYPPKGDIETCGLPDLSGLTVDVIYYPGGEMPMSQLDKYEVVMEDVDPLDYPDTFIIDTSKFDTNKAGAYPIYIGLTEEAQRKWWYCEPVDIGFSIYGSTVAGDVNCDEQFTIADVVLFEKWLLNDYEITPYWENLDLCRDRVLDIYDLVLMKQKLKFYVTNESDFVSIYESEDFKSSGNIYLVGDYTMRNHMNDKDGPLYDRAG